MGASQRTKGATYEREVAKQLGRLLALPDVKRKIDQAREGGEDLENTGALVVECKRRKTLKGLYDWMRQCITACGVSYYTGESIPVVIFRADNERSMVLIHLSDINRFATEVLSDAT